MRAGCCGVFASVLTCVALAGCSNSHRGLLLVPDGGKADVGRDRAAPVDLPSDGAADVAAAAAEVADRSGTLNDSSGDWLEASFADVPVDVAGLDLVVTLDLVPRDMTDGAREARSPSEDAPADVPLDAGAVDHATVAVDLPTAELAGAPVAAPSGGCVPAVVTPSLAFYGTVGIDFDEDGIADDADNCPATPSPDQRDGDGDGLGDVCDRCPGGPDRDRDGVCDDVDNCPADWNPSQYDVDGNRVGDRCDTQRCESSNDTQQLQPVLAGLLHKQDFAVVLADAHWRVISVQSYCQGNSLATRLGILDYRHRRQITVSYLIATQEMVSLQVADLTDLLGPQASAEEGREAMYLAEHDPQVRAVLDGLANLISAGAFFYEFGTQPTTNDPAFPTCASGRCIDVLYGGRTPDGGWVDYSVVVDMDACRALGIRPRP